MFRLVDVRLAIRVVGTGTSLNNLNRRPLKRASCSTPTDPPSGALRVSELPPSPLQHQQLAKQTDLQEQMFTKLLRIDDHEFHSTVAEFLSSSPDTKVTGVKRLRTLIPSQSSLKTPFVFVNAVDSHVRTAVLHLLLHHDCNPAAHFPSGRADLLLLYCCAYVEPLGDDRLRSSWERLHSADAPEVMLVDTNLPPEHIITVLRWVARSFGQGSLTDLTCPSLKNSHFHIPAAVLLRALQIYAKTPQSPNFTKHVEWLVKQTNAACAFEGSLSRQHPLSKKIDLVGGRAPWSSVVYDASSGTVTKVTGTLGSGATAVSAVARRLCGSIDEVTSDVFRWHLQGTQQAPEDLLGMICDIEAEQACKAEKDLSEVKFYDRQALFTIAVLLAMCLDGRSPTRCEFATKVRATFALDSDFKPSIFWGEHLHTHILTNGRMLLPHKKAAIFTAALLTPSKETEGNCTSHKVTRRLQSVWNTEMSLYLELMAMTDPFEYLKEVNANAQVIHSAEAAGSIVKALTLQLVLANPRSREEYSKYIEDTIKAAFPNGGYLHFGTPSVSAVSARSDQLLAELLPAFGHLSGVLSLDDGTLSPWEEHDEGSLVSIENSPDSPALVLLGRRHRNKTAAALASREFADVRRPLARCTTLPGPHIRVSLWKIDLLTLLLKMKSVIGNEKSVDSGIAARLLLPTSDEQLVVLSKPAKMSSSFHIPLHNAKESQDIVSTLLGPLHAGCSSDGPPRPVRVFNELGLLNRLDAHTTGVLLAVVPRSAPPDASSNLEPTVDTFQFMSTCANLSHSLEKKYLAVVHHCSLGGKASNAHLTPGWLLPQGVIRTHVKSVSSRGSLASETGVADDVALSSRSLYANPFEASRSINATTKYRVVRSFPASRSYLVELTLTSGRRHQIRQHMANIGFPLYGDVLYGGMRGPGTILRTALHASSITIPQPKGMPFIIESGSTVEGTTQRVRVSKTGDKITVGVAMPDDMQNLLAILEEREGKK